MHPLRVEFVVPRFLAQYGLVVLLLDSSERVHLQHPAEGLHQADAVLVHRDLHVRRQALDVIGGL